MSTVLRDAFSITKVSFWIGALLSSLIGSSLYIFTHRSIESDARERFNNHARYAQSVIEVRIKSYTDLLRNTASVLQSSNHIDHEEFHEYVRGVELNRHFPAIDSINFALHVSESDRSALMEHWRENIHRHLGRDDAPLGISPPGIRQEYLVVTYFEPDPVYPQLFGIDLLANGYFGTQLLQSRDQGTILVSGSPIPLLSRPNDIYLGMRLPVYRHGMPRDTVAQRRAAYTGSIGIAFSVPKLLHGAMDEIPLTGMRMTLFDTGLQLDAEGRVLNAPVMTLFDSRGTATVPRPALAQGDDIFSTSLPLDYNGRPWKTVYSVPKSALYTEFDAYYPKLMMAFGFLGSILLYALLYILTSSRRAALVLAREMTSELRESQSKLQLSHYKLRRLADHAYQIKELERKRIAREIHDDLGQNLLALRIETELLATRTKGSHGILHKRARATLLQIDTTIKSVRQIINDLRPTVLDLGLSAAVEWQVNQFQRRTGIRCEVHDDYGDIALPDHCATAFFRILQESLTNIVRHANATEVRVELRLNGDWLSLTVKDNGVGLPPGGHNKFGSFGLVGIEERIVILGGTCAVFSEPEGGTTVMVSAPVIGAAEPPLYPQHEFKSGSAVI
ncbi:sensor histidine kinase [Massilia sp. TN1-12]|uniref:sensor histidine kinase n=1 Tax=Massilia paldalensis TaxID=3377675 RepID=UPI00384D35BE